MFALVFGILTLFDSNLVNFSVQFSRRAKLLSLRILPPTEASNELPSSCGLNIYELDASQMPSIATCLSAVSLRSSHEWVSSPIRLPTTTEDERIDLDREATVPRCMLCEALSDGVGESLQVAADLSSML